MTQNNRQGREFKFQTTLNGGNNWNDIGGIASKEFVRERAISDTTSQSTPGNETEACDHGYMSASATFSGKVDKRSGVGLDDYKALSLVANSSPPQDYFRMTDGMDDAGETFEGYFLITSFGKTTDQNGIVEYSVSLINTTDLYYVDQWYVALEFFANTTLPDAWENIQYGTDFS